ncbi:hypothetical protein FC81_GL000067 [Liquorilactobacillus capillatus DSM 19910]|uniref:Uncharacterized protein n=1 Tax=Liquorilactobacillus capillatus DSM 19910 TaxID=1423731 RepID=A0A0R1M5G8_9LACO|nr:hypothetical protein FC81_GL000067 [Liquorilactobacillus capillatus DSM 19910]
MILSSHILPYIPAGNYLFILKKLLNIYFFLKTSKKAASKKLAKKPHQKFLMGLLIVNN